MRQSMRFAALLLLAAAAQASSLTFELPYGQRKCYSEDLAPSTDIRGEVHVAGGRGEMKLDLFVSDAGGTVYFHKSDVNALKFSFKTGVAPSHSKTGTQSYRFCIVNQVHPHSAAASNVARRVTLVVEALDKVRAGDMAKLATQGHVEKVQDKFGEVSRKVDEIIDRIDDLRVQEQALSDVNEDTSRMIMRISVLACLFTIATGALNFMSLKSFFKQKKLA